MNPMQAMIDGMGASMQAARSKTQMTLGGLIEHLALLDPARLIAGVGALSSYRGYYCDLAIKPEALGGRMPIRVFLRLCQAAMGETFEGYKGGEYQMGKLTPVWVADWGCCGDRLMGLEVGDDVVTLVTSPEPEDGP